MAMKDAGNKMELIFQVVELMKWQWMSERKEKRSPELIGSLFKEHKLPRKNVFGIDPRTSFYFFAARSESEK